MSSPPLSRLARPSRASTNSPRRGAFAPIAAASEGCAAPKRPSSSRVHRKREFVATARRHLAPRSPQPAEPRGRRAAEAVRRSGAQGRNRDQKPGRAPRGPNAGAAQIDADRPLSDIEAHPLEARLADRQRCGQMAQTPSDRSLAPKQSGLERIYVLDRKQRQHRWARGDDSRRRARNRQSRGVAEPVSRRQPQVESRGFFQAIGPRVQGRMTAANGSMRRS